jgi:hypothetical protein
MRVDRGGVVPNDPTPYGMGWWISSDNPGVYHDPGAFGTISFIDVERGIGGYVAIDDYSAVDAGAPIGLVRGTIIPLLQQAFDTAKSGSVAVTRQQRPGPERSANVSAKIKE